MSPRFRESFSEPHYAYAQDAFSLLLAYYFLRGGPSLLRAFGSSPFEQHVQAVCSLPPRSSSPE